MQQIGARDFAEARGFCTAREKASVHIREGICPTRQLGRGPIFNSCIHRTEDFADNLVCVRGIALGHLINRGREQVAAVKNAGVFRIEAENQPRHEMVHVMAAFRFAPFRIILQQLHIQLVQAACGADVKRALADLLNGGDAREREEEAEMVREIFVLAGDSFAGAMSSAWKSWPSVARMNLACVWRWLGYSVASPACGELHQQGMLLCGCCYIAGPRL